MASAVELRLPADEFALSHTLVSTPGCSIEVERLVAKGSDSLMPLVWVVAEDFSAFETALEDDPTVESFSVLSEFDEKRFYRVNWASAVEGVVRLLVEEEGVLTRIRAQGGTWRLQAICPDRESISRTYELCRRSGLSLSIESIYDLAGRDSQRYGLTESQYATLLTAYEQGYYEVPRRVSLSELAEELGISHQALSERLRRSHANLVERTLASATSEGDGRPRLANLN